MNNANSEFRKILVATDFSDSSETALRLAVWVAQQSHGEIVLAHVTSDLRRAVAHTSYRSRLEFLEGQEEHLQRELRHDSDQKLKQAIHQLGDTGVSISFETLLGEPHVELIHSVQQEGYDLVVAGTRGKGAWQQLFLGSTARKLIRKCPAPVWIVKRQPAQPPATILVAVDTSEASRRAVDQALHLAQSAHAQLHIVHVVEHQIPEHLLDLKPSSTSEKTVRDWITEEATQNFEAFLAPLQASQTPLHRHLLWGAPGEQIVTLSRKIKADLMVLGTVGRTGLKGLLLGNTAENVVVHCDCDVLAIKPAGFESPVTPATWPLHPGPENK
jgi:nucleotide-binding universal stress UspA family protein